MRTMENMVMLPDSNFWSGRKVFITGHTGFKGAWLSLWLTQLGAKITGFSLPSISDDTFFESLELKDVLNHLTGDINDISQLCYAIEQSEPDIIFHLAAQSIVAEGYENPIATWQTNVQGSANILQAIHLTQQKDTVVVMATTDKVYKNLGQSKPFKETDPLGGHDPYSASKAGAEILIDSWAKSYAKLWHERSNILLSVRAGNVIGGGDWSEKRVVPDMARAFSKNETLLIRSPNSVRPWKYVLDVLNGYLCLAQSATGNASFHGSAWNIGPDNEKMATVQDVINDALTLWQGQVEYDPTPTFEEATTLLLDNSKIVSQIGWLPLLSFEQSVFRTVSWYKKCLAGKNQKQLSLQDIESFYKSAEGRHVNDM